VTVSSTLTLPLGLTEDGRSDAIARLRAYFRSVTPTSGFAGSRFERLGGGGDRPSVAYEFTAEDILALTMLSIDVPPLTTLQILGPQRATLSALLRLIRTDVDFVDVEPAEIGPDWAPWRLWSKLMELDGIGWVTAGKLIARKRPRLIPIYDSVVQAEVNPTGSFWIALNHELRANDHALHKHLISLRDEAGIGDDISPLRVFDVVTWMTGQHYADT
jgi:hypothetical protein